MDIVWGVIGLLAVVGSTAAALAVRRADPARPWRAAGSDGAWSRRPEDPERLLLADRDAARAAVELAAARARGRRTHDGPDLVEVRAVVVRSAQAREETESRSASPARL
ncbi:hypothetical protein [Cellulosimicrobium sp. NPDC057127]|uniref:hypothetical protein n=1 Tax=Cellulosimicrobium sp. NPDC057127 TaxID=3346026 RepID=UPI00364572A2